ncbi:metal-dependent transcriptional regulator [Corynebacterium caspium]|uniref:metal-dependent transcriptional regulator n=1 Tax=Corynebacterium caspium TaxID=234828 RepID=UPI0003659697|nr:metal-dependent transcriptional regulator [Corynebacterium caspium]WKD59139.1 Diphtheria toxin repressor [Corynebacterium caspium DSM 44850]
MKDLVDTTEMYLRTIYELEEEGIVPLRARIVERLEQSGPTVSQTVARMERDGLLHVRADRSLELTPEGRIRATEVMRKHRLAERLLTDVLKLDIDRVHEEACRWEHVMSEEVERRVIDILGEPSHSPFGNPIPGLDKLGVTSETVAAAITTGIRPIDLPFDVPTKARVLQINEILQVDTRKFRAFCEAGIEPGVEIIITNDHGEVIVNRDNKEIVLGEELGHALRIEVIED